MPIEMPSVTPCKELLTKQWDVAIDAWLEFGQKNYYKLKDTNPAGWNNFMLYGKLLAQFQTEEQQAAMPMMPPGKPGTTPALPAGSPQ